MKGTLLEGAGSPGAGTGGGWLPVPQEAPGMVAKLFQPLRLEDLLGSGVATGNTVRYAVEGTATSAAAGVAEGGTKPESTLAYSTLDEPIKKIATVVTISDELLEDAPAMSAFINSRLSLSVQIEAERQLIRGTSGGNEVQGLLTSRGVPVYAGGTAVGNRAVQLFKAMNGTRGSSFTEPEWFVLHPTDYEAIRLLTDSAGQFFGGGPFMGPYGSGSSASASGQINGVVDTLWGKPVYVTTAIGGAGTALLGSSAAAQVWSKGGVQVESTNSHASNFVLDLSVIRAERRLGLTLFRPSALCEVRLA
jgi:HK97 family phage major capsid protein